MLTFILGFIFTLILTPLARTVALKLNIVDNPNDRKVHNNSMPYLGGVAIYLSFSFAYILTVYFTDAVATHVGYALLFGGFLIVVTGVLDDAFDISAKYKILGQFLAALVAIYFGLRIQYISLPFQEDLLYIGWLGIPLTIFWILAITNAINLIDGLDGLASGVSGIAALGLFFVSLSIGNVMIAMMTLLLVGCILAFLIFNFHPAKIFMGDSGSLFLGFFLSTISLLELKQATLVTFVIPILVLAVPISDTLYAMIRRKLNKKPISEADKSHLHHCLMALGFSHRKAVLLIYVISIFFAVLGILLTKATLWVSIVCLLFYFIFFEIFAESIGMMNKNHRPLIHLYKRICAIFH